MTNPANVNVICRFRPMNDLERTNGNEQVCEFTSQTSLTFYSSREKNKYRFNFDRIFPPQSTQQELYDFGVKKIIDSVLEGYNGTVLAYGQTSSGKTYTMQGIMDSEVTQGIIPRMIKHVFNHIRNSDPSIQFMLKVSMIEIYLEKIRDLIDVTRKNLSIREDSIKGIYVEGVSENYVCTENEILNFLDIGSSNRAQAATAMNEHSSRSHSIFILTVNQTYKNEGTKVGKLYLVDLAGSEKISKTGAVGHTLEEAKIINKSLTTLGRVINSLTDGKSFHIPYRESKLTRVLQESLGGNSKTCLIITCSPSVYNESESLSTLRFGERAKNIKNKAKINKEITVAELQRKVNELEEKLKKANGRISQLEAYIKQNGLKPPESNYQVEPDEEQKNKQKDEKERIADEDRKIEELAQKLNLEDTPFGDMINNALNPLLDSDDNFENRVEVIANLKALKEKYDKKGIIDAAHEKEGGKNNDAGNNGNNNSNNNNINSINATNVKIIKGMQISCTKFLNKLQTIREIQENPNIVKFIKSFQEYINKITNMQKGDNNNTTKEDDANIPINGSNNLDMELKPKEDKDTQTEKLENEVDQIKEKFEKEKRILYKKIDDNEQTIGELETEIKRIKEKNKLLEDETPFDEKKLKEKNMTLENNLKELRKKLEESQVRRLMAENQNNVNVKAMREKNQLIGSLEKKIEELTKNNGIKGLQPSVANMIRVIAGGSVLKGVNGNSSSRK